MPAPSPRTKPSRFRSNGFDAFSGSSLCVDRAVSRLKPVTPMGWIMLCGAAGQHQVGVAVADHLGRLADRLAAGGAGGQAAVIRAEQTEIGGEVAGRGVQLLLGLRAGLELRRPSRAKAAASTRRSSTT